MRYADSNCTYREVYEPQHGYIFSGPCVVTGKTVEVFVPGPGLYAYRHGKHIQDAFPEMPKGDREFLISGMSSEGWDQTFGVPEMAAAD